MDRRIKLKTIKTLTKRPSKKKTLKEEGSN
jgi:hypothetical protein